MNDGNIKLILNSFEGHRRAIPERGRVWRWAEGVILFPEALCPSCNGVMRSPRIWQVDERSQRLVIVACLDGKVAKVASAVHPHVDGSSGGRVCIGDAHSVSEALFFGLGRGRPYWAADSDWYKRAFDHICTRASRRNSRNHLTASMELTQEQKARPDEVVSSAVETVISDSRRQRREELRQREAAVREAREAHESRRQRIAEPLFNGTMAGNMESTGISTDDQPAGLHVDRL